MALHLPCRDECRNLEQMDETALLSANAAYYRAFAARDAEAMSKVWAADGVSCVHPGWPAIVGRVAVLASYRDIFRNPRQEAVAARDEKTLIEKEDGRVFCVEEVGGGLLLATNWFRLIDGRWRLAHHQASPLAMAPVARPEEKRSLH
jgi:ketosteroid isomerase-like protein